MKGDEKLARGMGTRLWDTTEIV